MDNLSIISGALFLSADLFAIASLTMPDWIVSAVGGGETHIGLLETCLTIPNRNTTCYLPENIRAEWLFTFLCIVIGVVCITVTVILLAASYWNPRVTRVARWLGLAAMVLFCLAAVIFPLGFDIDMIGGSAYQLPASFRIGMSYIFFVLALWITVISELFAGKVCLPHF